MIAWLKQNPATAALVAIAALLAILVWRDQESVTTDEAESRKTDLFEVWRPDAITRVEITAHGKTAALSRAIADADGGEHPFRVAIDGQDFATDRPTVDEYMGRLELARMLRKADGVDRKSAALDAPRVTIDVTTGDRRQRLAIGGPAPSPAGALYAEVEGRGVFVITAQLASALDVDVDTLRTRSFLSIATSDIASLWIDGAAGARHLDRAPWGSARGAGFRFEASTPEGAVRADGTLVGRILLGLEHLQADRHLSNDEAARALHTEVTLRLTAKDPSAKPVVVEIGGACPARGDAGESSEDVVAIRREPTREAACVPKDVLEALDAKKEALLDRHAIGAAIDEVSELVVRDGDRTLDMARTSGAWHLRAPSDRAIDAEVGRGVLEGMLAVEGDLVKRDLGPVTPRGSIRIIGVDAAGAGDAGSGERVESIDLVADKTGALFARRSEDGATLAISAESAQNLLPSDLALRAHRVFDEPNKRFQSLRIEGPNGVQALTRTPGGGWAASEPKVTGAGADAGLTNDIVDAMGHLGALRWIADKDDGTFGLDHPRFSIEATLADEGDAGAPTKIKIALGAATADGSFARREGDPAVFVAPKSLEAAASRWLLDRTVLMIEPSEVTRVTLAQGKRRAVFERAGSALRLVGDASPEAATRAAGVRDAIADLVAEGAVSLGAAKKEQGFDKPMLDIAIERSTGAKVHIAIGAGDSLRGTSVYYARRDGVDATYAIAQGKVKDLIEAL